MKRAGQGLARGVLRRGACSLAALATSTSLLAAASTVLARPLSPPLRTANAAATSEPLTSEEAQDKAPAAMLSAACESPREAKPFPLPLPSAVPSGGVVPEKAWDQAADQGQGMEKALRQQTGARLGGRYCRWQEMNEPACAAALDALDLKTQHVLLTAVLNHMTQSELAFDPAFARLAPSEQALAGGYARAATLVFAAKAAHSGYTAALSELADKRGAGGPEAPPPVSSQLTLVTREAINALFVWPAWPHLGPTLAANLKEDASYLEAYEELKALTKAAALAAAPAQPSRLNSHLLPLQENAERAGLAYVIKHHAALWLRHYTLAATLQSYYTAPQVDDADPY